MACSAIQYGVMGLVLRSQALAASCSLLLLFPMSHSLSNLSRILRPYPRYCPRLVLRRTYIKAAASHVSQAMYLLQGQRTSSGT